MVRLLTSGSAGSAVDAGLLLLRLFFELSLAFAHGIGKLPPSDRFIAGVTGMGFPVPLVFAWASAFAEFICGLLVASGLATRPAAFFVLLNMFVAAFIRQAGDPFSELELALTYLAASAAVLLAGAGRYSLDAVVQRRFVTSSR